MYILKCGEFRYLTPVNSRLVPYLISRRLGRPWGFLPINSRTHHIYPWPSMVPEPFILKLWTSSKCIKLARSVLLVLKSHLCYRLDALSVPSIVIVMLYKSWTSIGIMWKVVFSGTSTTRPDWSLVALAWRIAYWNVAALVLSASSESSFGLAPKSRISWTHWAV